MILRLSLALFLCAGALAVPAQAYVYWTNNGPGLSSTGTTLGRADLDASGVTNSLVTTASGPAGIAVDAGHIYWANAATNSIGIANLDGSGANPTWIVNATTQGTSTAVLVNGAHIYWTDGIQYVGRADLTGKNVNPHFVDAGLNAGANGIGIAAGTLFIAQFNRIATVPVTGGSPVTLVTLSGNVITTGLAVAGGYVYWSAADLAKAAPDGEIGRVLTSGGTPVEAFVTNLSFPTGVATDGVELYWADHSANQIGRALLGSAGATNIQPAFESPQGGPWGVAIDSLIDPTQTSISCSPSTVATGSPSTCKATVSDSASSATPTGTVVFSGNGSVFFSGSSSCTLTPRAGGGASCVAAAVPTNPGGVPINVSYGGDAVHSPSNGAATICATPASACTPATGPSNTTPPAISGTAAVGQVVTCSQGSWSGTTPLSFTYTWLRDGAPIAGATRSSYTLALSDAGHRVSCSVTATNGAASASANSASRSVPRQPIASAGRAKVGRGGTLKVTVSCAGPSGARCTTTLAITVTETFSGKKLLAVGAAKRSKKVVTLVGTTIALATGHRRTVTMTLGRTGKRLLARAHKLKVTLTIMQLIGAGHGAAVSSQTPTFAARR